MCASSLTQMSFVKHFPIDDSRISSLLLYSSSKKRMPFTVYLMPLCRHVLHSSSSVTTCHKGQLQMRQTVLRSCKDKATNQK